MRRKVIKQRDSYTITLPMKWVSKFNLEKGDELDMSEVDSNLVIGAIKRFEVKSTIVKIKDSSSLRSIIGYAYRAGFQKIRLVFENNTDLISIEETLKFFTGLEIESFSPEKVDLIMITRPEKGDFDFFINKIFQGIDIMFEDVIKALEGKKLNIKEIEQLRTNNLRAREYVMRTINTEGVKGQIGDYYTYVHIMEKMSGSLWHIGQYLDNNKVKVNSNLIKLVSELKGLLQKSRFVFVKKDIEL